MRSIRPESQESDKKRKPPNNPRPRMISDRRWPRLPVDLGMENPIFYDSLKQVRDVDRFFPQVALRPLVF